MVAKESDIQAACLRMLSLFRVFHWRNNTGVARLIGKGGKPRPVRFGVPGAPDIMAIRRGEFWGIECKRPLGPKGGANGSVLSDEQATFGKDIINSGGHYIVVRSAEEMIEKMGLDRLAAEDGKGGGK